MSKEKQYAISEYHDTDEIYARLNALVSQPIRPIRREKHVSRTRTVGEREQKQNQCERRLKHCGDPMKVGSLDHVLRHLSHPFLAQNTETEFGNFGLEAAMRQRGKWAGFEVA